jgi:hypothetical protein
MGSPGYESSVRFTLAAGFVNRGPHETGRRATRIYNVLFVDMRHPVAPEIGTARKGEIKTSAARHHESVERWRRQRIKEL